MKLRRREHTLRPRIEEDEVRVGTWRQLTLSVIGSALTTASTLLGVTRLGFSGQLVEVDLTAAL